MRLAQIARELKATPKQISKYLEKKGIDLEKGLNEKLDEALLDELREVFKPFEEEENSDWSVQSKKEEAPSQVDSLSELEGDIEFEEQLPEEVEHIKADVPDLEGIKVVGKIDLPEPKLKEEEEEPEEVQMQTEAVEETPKPEKRQDARKKKRNRREPLSDEEKQRREEKRMAKERAAREAKRKEIRKQNYLNSVQQQHPIKKKPEPVKEVIQEVEEQSAPPAREEKPGLLKRAFRWLYYGE